MLTAMAGVASSTVKIPLTVAVVQSGTSYIGVILSGTTPLVINTPTGTVDSDLMVAAISVNSGTIATPTGWTLLASSTSTNNRLSIYYRTAASEPTTQSWSITPGIGGDSAVGGIMRIDGHNASNPIDDNNLATGNNSDPIAPALSNPASTEQSLRLRFASVDSGDTVEGTIWGGYAKDGDSNDVSGVVNAAQRDTNTSSIVGSYTFPNSGGSNWNAHTVVVAPG